MAGSVGSIYRADKMFPTTPCNTSPSLLYTPSRPSPLTTRPHNTANMVINSKTLPSPLPPPPPPPPPSPGFFAPRRLFKPVPVLVSRERSREARRELFLRKVKKGREDKILKSRGGEDEIMRLIFVSEQKRWEATQARAAATIPTIYEEDEPEASEVQHYEPPDQFIGATEDDNLDKLIEREGEELEATLSQLYLDFNHIMLEDPFRVQGQT